MTSKNRVARTSTSTRFALAVPLPLLFLLAACNGSSAGSSGRPASVRELAFSSVSNFAVLGASTVTCTAGASVSGDVGVSPGTSITGFNPDCTIAGTIHASDAPALQAHNELATGFDALGAEACEHKLTGQDLGGQTLAPGVYCFDSSAGLTGTLTLDAAGDSSAAWVFQVGSALTTAPASSVVMAGTGQACNVFWRIGSSATIGTGTAFQGNILASASVTLTTGSSLVGRALAVNAAVTIDHSTIGLGACTGSSVSSVDAGSPVNPTDAGQPIGPIDAGQPIVATDAGQPIVPTDAGQPIVPIDAGSPDAGTPTVSLAPSLGSAAQFAVLGASTVTCTNASAVTGDVGVSPGTAITGFAPSCTVAGTIHGGDAAAIVAHADLVTAYGALTAVACQTNLTGQDLGGLTLAPGVYCFNSTAGITGQLTLDGKGDPNAVWIFQIGTAITTATGSSVVTQGSAQACNVFWQVGSSATIGTATAFQGNVLASASITLVSGSTLAGRALAVNAAVTLDQNTVALATCLP